MTAWRQCSKQLSLQLRLESDGFNHVFKGRGVNDMEAAHLCSLTLTRTQTFINSHKSLLSGRVIGARRVLHRDRDWVWRSHGPSTLPKFNGQYPCTIKSIM